ncbi:MAG: 1-deoxy-D-xylulose 5-phosphate reductoisomerase [Ignavibacteria bacterium]|nr:1-deoxy-D-xylulose 5-phosphate reductoisomerase [Ignavibacteria bacterium]
MAVNIKRISILGSTGSIGCNSLKVIENLKKKEYPIKVVSLTTNKNIDLLAKQIAEHSPNTVVIQDLNAYKKFVSDYYFPELEILQGESGLADIAGRNNYDLLLSALVGFSGLIPTINALKLGKNVALANKETLVIAGKLINDVSAKNNAVIYPIDSEHSAIFQCLLGESADSVSRLIITASGGPFRNKSLIEMKNASVEDALNHPNWSMGKKITIDSATMMNKGLEIIEAHWLFNLNADQLDVIIHPQSIIHSMVEFRDNSVKAQLGIPDMRIPIQFAITYPERIESEFCKMDFGKFNNLTFEEPDLKKFRCLKLAFDALNSGGTYPAVLNAANEIAVELFLNEKVNFLSISEIIEEQLNKHNNNLDFELDDVIEIDRSVKSELKKKYSLD